MAEDEATPAAAAEEEEAWLDAADDGWVAWGADDADDDADAEEEKDAALDEACESDANTKWNSSERNAFAVIGRAAIEAAKPVPADAASVAMV